MGTLARRPPYGTRSHLQTRAGGHSASRTLWRRPFRCRPRRRPDTGTGVRAERGVVGGKSLPCRPQRIVRSPWRDWAGRRRIADLWRRSSPCAGARSSRWRSDIGTGVRAERGVVGGRPLPRRPPRIVRSPWRDRAGRQRIADLVAPVFPARRYPQPAPAPRHRQGIASPRPGTRTGVRPARCAGPPPPRPVTPRTPSDRPGAAPRNPAAAPRVSPVDGPHIGLKASPEPGIATMGTPEPDRGTRIAHEESSWQTRPSP